MGLERRATCSEKRGGEKKQTAHFISVCPASETKYLDEVMNRRVESKASSTLESRKAFNRCESSQDMCCALNESTAYAAPRSPIINGRRVAQHVHLPIHSLQAPLPQRITQGRLVSSSSPNTRPKFQEDNRSLGKECSSIKVSVSCALHNLSDHALERHQRLSTNSEYRIALSAMTLVTPLSTRQQFLSAIVKTMQKQKINISLVPSTQMRTAPRMTRDHVNATGTVLITSVCLHQPAAVCSNCCTAGRLDQIHEKNAAAQVHVGLLDGTVLFGSDVAQRCVSSRGPHELHRTTCAKMCFMAVAK